MTTRIFGGPHLYIQGENALGELPSETARYGERPLIVADPIVTDLFGNRLQELFGDVTPVFADFGGECTAAEIDRIGYLAKAASADVVIGMGGGKAIDTAKGVRIALALPIIVVPTIASNDSPTSRLAVLYTPDHVLSEVRLMPTNPDVVLVDSTLIAAAPVRFFVAGIGDALSKYFEVRQCSESGGRNFYGGRPTRLVSSIAQTSFQIIREQGNLAVSDVSAKRVSPAVEDVIEACVLLSGLSFESGGLSIAHSLTRGFSAVPELGKTLHGEQVALGLLVQLAMESRGQEPLRELFEYYSDIGLPTSIEALGGNQSDWRRIAQVTVETAPYIANFESAVEAEDIVDAFRLLSKI